MRMSMGTKDSSRVKREVEMNGWVFIILFTLFVVAVLFIVSIAYTGSDRSLSLGCSDNTEEKIEFGKEMYCGEHYSVLKDKISEEKYNEIENIIKNGTR